MAGSSTENMDNFGTQAVERHQMIMNTDVMKHITIMNQTSVREIMLEHEKTFKEQVHDLHKLYEVQKSLMHKAKDGGNSMFYIGCSQSIGQSIQSLPEHHDNLKQIMNFWESKPIPMAVTESLKSVKVRPYPDLEKTIKDIDDLSKQQKDAGIVIKLEPKNTNSSARKKVIDLEQLPEDDSDDECDQLENVNLPLSEPVCTSSHQVNVKVYSSSNYGMSNTMAGENSAPTSCSTASLSSSKSFQDSNCRPNPAENLPALDNKSMAFGGAKGQSVAGACKTTLAQIESHVDLVCRAVGDDTPWRYQGPGDSVKPSSSTQRQEKLIPLHGTAEPFLKDYHQYAHQSSKSHVATSSLVGNWTKPSAESAVQFVSSLETSAISFTSETYLPGGQFAGVVTAGSLKGQHKDREEKFCYQENSVMQFRPYQQSQAVFVKPLTNVNQISCLQPSQNAHGDIYLQQGIYSAHVSDALHIGPQVGGLPISQVEGKSPWNTSNTGNYYPNVHQIIQKRPFEKSSNLLSKVGADRIDLKVVSPENQLDENPSDSPQDHSKCPEKKAFIQRDEAKGKEVMHEDEAGVGTLMASLQPSVLNMPMASALHMQKERTSENVNEEANSATPCRVSDPPCAGRNDSSTTENSSAKEHNFSSVSSDENTEQKRMECLLEGELNNNEQSTSPKEGGSASARRGTLEHAYEDNQDFAVSGQESNMVPSKDELHEGSTTFDKSHVSSEHVNMSVGSSSLEGMEGLCNNHLVDNRDIHLQSRIYEGKDYLGNGAEIRDVVEMKQFERPKSDSLLPSVPVKGRCRKDDNDTRAKTIQSADLGSSNQTTVQAAGSMQSSHTEAPCTIKAERECSSKESENNAKEFSSSISRKRKPTTSDDYENLPILPSAKSVFEYKGVVALDEWNDDLPHISDSDCLAAAILMSFAPKKKTGGRLSAYQEDDVNRCPSNSKHGESSSKHAIAGGTTKVSSPKCKIMEPSDCRSSKEKLKKLVDKKQLDMLCFTLQERKRQDSQLSPLLQRNPKSDVQMDLKSDQKGDLRSNQKADLRSNQKDDLRSSEKNNIQSNTRGKILKIGSKLVSSIIEDDEAVEAVKPRQPNKLNGPCVVFPPRTSDGNHIYHQQHSIGQKRKETHPPPTGRRSSRGQPQHRLSSQHSGDNDNDIHPDELEPSPFRTRDQSSHRAEVRNKSKAWCDINKKANRQPNRSLGKPIPD